MSLITIEQLLASVGLDFEPRWITKDRSGYVEIWSNKPKAGATKWYHISEDTIYQSICKLKLAEFDGKPWTECIYEVPRKPTGNIKKLGKLNVSGTNMTMNRDTVDTLVNTLNQVIDAVNELKAKFALPTLNPDLTDEDLRKMMRDPKYWRDKDSATIQKVQDGFNKLYGDKE